MFVENAVSSYACPVITPEQISAARELLGWKQQDLADKAGISKNTVSNIERGNEGQTRVLKAIEAALREVGIVFIEPGLHFVGGKGVMLTGKPERGR